MNELMTRESGQMAALFRMLEHALDHIELLAENYRPKTTAPYWAGNAT